jgi:hypothetical protein
MIWNEIRCQAGQPTEPTDCERHTAHHYCPDCTGWFGIPHDGRCHSAEVRQDRAIPGVGRPMPNSCACTYCRTWKFLGYSAAEEMRGKRPGSQWPPPPLCKRCGGSGVVGGKTNFNYDYPWACPDCIGRAPMDRRGGVLDPTRPRPPRRTTTPTTPTPV